MGIDPRLRRFGRASLAAILCIAIAWTAGLLVERRSRADLALSVAADARLRQNLLASEIARFRLLPIALSGDSDLAAALRASPGAPRALDIKLERLAGDTGAAAIFAIGRDGRAIAASNWRTPRSFVGQDYRFRPYYRDAARTGAGQQFAFGTISRKPGLYLSRRSPDGGVVVVKLEFDTIERQWAAAGGITWATNQAGIVLVASRPGWRFAATAPIDAASAAAARAEIGIAAFRSSPVRRIAAGRAVVAGGRGETLTLAQAPPDPLGWTVRVAMPDGTAIDTAVRTAQIAAGLAALLLCGLGWTARAQSRRRRERTSALEAAVAERTADLRREMAERAALEARAADLREGLRQANRLAALGQITASVAHETAQPVAAIRTYAATSEQLRDRGALDDVRDNLRAIARLTTRIGTVTAELRGFARKGTGTIQPVPLVEIVDGARLILKERLSRVAFALPAIAPDLLVMAGRVRLEQVLVNVLQNATEAEGRGDAAIAVALAIAQDGVRLTIADNGPGIAADVAARLFTPFVTSRPTGLGLGLVIAQDIMVDLGGALRLVPAARGACFEIELRRP